MLKRNQQQHCSLFIFYYRKFRKYASIVVCSFLSVLCSVKTEPKTEERNRSREDPRNTSPKCSRVYASYIKLIQQQIQISLMGVRRKRGTRSIVLFRGIEQQTPPTQIFHLKKFSGTLGNKKR